MKKGYSLIVALVALSTLSTYAWSDSVEGPAFRGIQISNTLQRNATFYVSSGTVTNLQTTTLKFNDGTTMTTAASGGGGSGGYAVQPATVTFQLNKGLSTSTETITGLSPGVMHVLATSSNVTTGLVSLSTEVTGVLPLSNMSSGATYYIRNSNALQSGATAYPDFVYVGTSETVRGNFQATGTTILGSLSGVLKASAGTVSGSATTTDLTEGSNLYYTVARTTTNFSAVAPIVYSNGVYSIDKTSATLLGPAPTTSSIPEGSNLYFTTARATSSISATAPITYSNGVIGGDSSILSTTTAASTYLSQSSATATYFNKSSVYVSSVNGNSAITVSANGTAGSVVSFSANSSSVTLFGQSIPAAAIAAGSLGASVIASSFTPSGVTAGSYAYTNLTVDSQGRITSASNGAAISLSTGVTGRLPVSNQSFSYQLQPLSSKFLSPGTTNFPKVDQSTTTGTGSLYWDSSSTQTVTWTSVLAPYAGGTFNVDFNFTGSSVTSGNVSWGVFVKCSGSTQGVSVDNIFQGYTVQASTGGAIPSTAGNPSRLKISSLSANGCNENDLLNILITRNHNIASDAVGDVRSFVGRIYEN